MQKSTSISLFKEMVKIRAVEEHIAKNYFPEGREQEMRCPTHFIYWTGGCGRRCDCPTAEI